MNGTASVASCVDTRRPGPSMPSSPKSRVVGRRHWGSAGRRCRRPHPASERSSRSKCLQPSRANPQVTLCPTTPSRPPATGSGVGNHYRLSGDLTFHGVTRPAHGTVTVETTDENRLVITGEQVFDIRDFDIPSPTVLMLRIYPDVRVRLHVEVHLEET